MERRTINGRLIALLGLACVAMVAALLVAIITQHLVAGLIAAGVIRMAAAIVRSQMGL